ncbi:MAG TPA: PQQ-binding-like beta-propeller repeat protein [Candidatus Thermoplasmatota archaeon]|nr:PQQ-binding-like beta-propeller repeat protein [Candidatus Thermoplasmatota archaeon]
MPSVDETIEGMIVSPDGSRVYAGGWGSYRFSPVEYRASGFVAVLDGLTGAPIWRVDLGRQGASNWIYGIVVSGDRIYTTGTRAAGDPTGLQDVRAWNASTGVLLWTRDFAPAPDGVPWGAVRNGKDILVSSDGRRLFIVGDEYGYGNHIFYASLDAETGSTLWETDLQADIGGRSVHSALTASGDAILGAIEIIRQGTLYQAVSVDADSGAIRWLASFPPGSEVGDFGDILVAPRGDVVHFAGGGHSGPTPPLGARIVTIEAATGLVLASRFYGRDILAQTLTQTGSMGSPQGLHHVTDAAISPDGSTLYLIGGDDGLRCDCEIPAAMAVSAASGEILWMTRWGSDSDPVGSARSLSVAQSGAIAITTEGAGAVGVTRFEPLTGTPLFTTFLTSLRAVALEHVAQTHDGSAIFVGAILVLPADPSGAAIARVESVRGIGGWSLETRTPSIPPLP